MFKFDDDGKLSEKTLNKIFEFCKWYALSIAFFSLIYIIIVICPAYILIKNFSEKTNITFEINVFQTLPFIIIITLFPIIMLIIKFMEKMKHFKIKDIEIALQDDSKKIIQKAIENNKEIVSNNIIETNDELPNDERNENKYAYVLRKKLQEKYLNVLRIIQKHVGIGIYKVLEILNMFYDYRKFDIKDIAQTCKDKRIRIRERDIIKSIVIFKTLGIIEEDEGDENILMLTGFGREFYQNCREGGDLYV